MIHSMTAFSEVQFQSESMVLSWELRSLNHRYLDVSFRLPDSLRHIEARLRQGLRGKINRGKLDCQFKMNDVASEQSSIVANEPLIQGLLREGRRLSFEYSLADDIKLSDILAWPGVLEKKISVNEDLVDTIEQLFHQGLEQLLMGRRNEGAALEAQIQLRLPLLRQEIAAARESSVSMLSVARQKLMKRLDDLNVKVGDTRLEQELAFILTRLDISEELDRLDAHVNEVELTLSRDESIGKRLDFLMQELNREANTLSSKSDSLRLSQHALQMKVLIEQIREQIQNIE